MITKKQMVRLIERLLDSREMRDLVTYEYEDPLRQEKIDRLAEIHADMEDESVDIKTMQLTRQGGFC